MGQHLSTLRESLESIPGTLNAIPGTVNEAVSDKVKPLADKIMSVSGTVTALPNRLLAYPEALLERMKAVLPGTLKYLPGTLKKENEKISELPSEEKLIVPTESVTPEKTSQATVETPVDALNEIAKKSREFLVKNGYSNPEDAPSAGVQLVPLNQQSETLTGFQIGYTPIFIVASGYYVIVSLQPRSWTDLGCLVKLFRYWPTHLMWGFCYGACTCLAASLFPPYTQWFVMFLTGWKFIEGLITLTLRAHRGGFYNKDADED